MYSILSFSYASAETDRVGKKFIWGGYDMDRGEHVKFVGGIIYICYRPHLFWGEYNIAVLYASILGGGVIDLMRRS